MENVPLSRANRIRLAQVFAESPRPDLAIDSVLEGQMGKAFAEEGEGASVFAVRAGPFIYFAGDAASPAAPQMMDELLPGAFLMPSQSGFLEAALEHFGQRLEPVRRFSYSAQGLSWESLGRLAERSKYGSEIARMDLPFITRAWNRTDGIELSEFESPQDFLERGIGYHLSRGKKFIGGAYSSLVSSRGIEVSIFVRPDYRGQGIATVLACRLLQWCLEHHVAPHWDAANEESCKLAEKLGYLPAGEYTAHYVIP
jgi:RimJ/RimL family protein N-acetyltransferase